MKKTLLHDMIFGGLLGFACSKIDYTADILTFFLVMLIGTVIWHGISYLSLKKDEDENN